MPPTAATPPTALSWLRRRLSSHLPESSIRKLFRSETVRLFDPATGQVKRAARDRPLPPGAQLLVPRSALPSAVDGQTGCARPRRAPAPASPAASQARAEWLRRLRASLVHQDADLLAINKPAGLAVQGGSGLALSVDDLMREAFGQLLPDAGAGLRLVHRLDKETSGLLLLARHADAATWLGEAFRAGAAGGGGGRGGGSSGGGAAVRKMYFALVDCRGDTPSFPVEGSIDRPVAPRSGTGAAGGAPVPALTRYRGLEAGRGLAWLQLQPLTGRKHQLRVHCAQALGAPILGDARYAPARASPAQQAATDALHSMGVLGGRTLPSNLPLFLHCRGLEVRRPGVARPLPLMAPLPLHWRALLQWAGWPLPQGEDT